MVCVCCDQACDRCVYDLDYYSDPDPDEAVADTD